MSADVSTGVFMEAADGSILALIHRPDMTPAGHTVAGFQVEDLNGTVGSLKEAGIEFEEYDSPDPVPAAEPRAPKATLGFPSRERGSLSGYREPL